MASNILAPRDNAMRSNSVPGEPDAVQGASEASAQQIAWARARRAQIRLAGGFAAVLAVLTTYFGALNAYVLYRSVPLPYQLLLRSPFVSAPASSYKASVTWAPMSSTAKDPIRPRLFLGESQIPVDEGRPLEKRQGGPESLQELRIEVPSLATPGEHRGEIVLRRVGPSDVLPGVASLPVRIVVSGGFWASWFVIRDWLLFVGAVVALTYLICLAVFPAPAGTLQVLVSKAGHGRASRVRLGLRKSAWFFPWRRSVLPLGVICRKAGIKAKVRGELLFIGPALPVLFLDVTGLVGLERRRGDPVPIETARYEAFETCGPIDTMYESNTYRLSGVSGTDGIWLRYTRRSS